MTEPAETAIECRDVWKIFGHDPRRIMASIRADPGNEAEILRRNNAVLAVAEASFTVARGEIFCIMGLSGSGKSTLVRHINGLIQPSSGQVMIDGVDIAGQSPSALRALRAEKIAMVFQSFALLPHRNVTENVAFGLELRRVPVEQRNAVAARMLEQVGLAGWGHRRTDQLSGGMQQRVGLARALAGDPALLLMDEPFGALDPLIRRQLQDQFLDLSRVMRKTTIFITHDLDEAMRMGSRIAIMRAGRLVQVGTPGEIVRKPADSYVADFVAGISRLKFVRASDIMAPLAQNAAGMESWPRAALGSDLDDLIGLSLGSAHPVVVLDAMSQPVGLVDRDALLRSVRGVPA